MVQKFASKSSKELPENTKITNELERTQENDSAEKEVNEKKETENNDSEDIDFIPDDIQDEPLK